MSMGVYMVALSLDLTMSKFLCAIFIQVSNVICTVVVVVIVCSFVCACILCTILGHPRRRGRETDIRRPLDPARPGALLLGTPRCSGRAVTPAASWVDGRAAHSDFYIGCEYPTFYNTQYITFVLVHIIAAVAHSCLLPSFFCCYCKLCQGR